MPVREVEETEYLASEKLRKTVQAMLGNPDARRKLLEAEKIVNPQAAIPEIDSAKPLEDKIAALQKQIDDDKKARAEKDEKDETERKLAQLNGKWEKGREKLREQGYTEEGIKKIEELMASKNIIDHEDGLTIYEKHNPPPSPGLSTGPNWNFFETPKEGEDSMKKLLESKGEDESVLRKMTNEALSEVRSNAPTRR